MDQLLPENYTVNASTNHNNNTSGDPSPKLVTPETDRRKTRQREEMIGPSVETPNEVSEAALETKTSRLCAGRRYQLDLDSVDPQTKFPTKQISDHTDYVKQATAVENESNHPENLESGDVCVINIVNDEQNLLERQSAEE